MAASSDLVFLLYIILGEAPLFVTWFRVQFPF